MIFFSRVIFNFIQLSIFSFLIKDADLKLVRCRNPWGQGKNVSNELNYQAFMMINQMPFKVVRLHTYRFHFSMSPKPNTYARLTKRLLFFPRGVDWSVVRW